MQRNTNVHHSEIRERRIIWLETESFYAKDFVAIQTLDLIEEVERHYCIHFPKPLEAIWDRSRWEKEKMLERIEKNEMRTCLVFPLFIQLVNQSILIVRV